MGRCQNCGKTAMFLVGPEQIPMCLDCKDKLNQMLDRENVQLERLMNYFTGQMEAVTGIYGVLPRFPERHINVVQGGRMTRMTLNNINISGSNIGVLNTGNLRMVDSAITILNANPNNREVSDAIRKLTTAIAESTEMTPDKKNEAIEIVGGLAAAATIPKERRKPVIIKLMLSALPTAIQTAASVTQIWQEVGPIVTKFFK